MHWGWMDREILGSAFLFALILAAWVLAGFGTLIRDCAAGGCSAPDAMLLAVGGFAYLLMILLMARGWYLRDGWPPP